jgi:hypothetical protein
MLSTELQTLGDGLRGSREASVKAETACVLALADHSVDEKKISLCRRDDVPSVRSHVDSDDGVSERRQRRLRVLPDGVEQPNLALLAADRKTTLLGGRDARKLLLGRVLLELRVHHLASRHARIDAIECVARRADECLLCGHLGELRLGRDVRHRNVFMNRPLLDDLAALDVHTEERVGVILVHDDHLGVLLVEHHLKDAVSLWKADSK